MSPVACFASSDSPCSVTIVSSSAVKKRLAENVNFGVDAPQYATDPEGEQNQQT